MRWFWPIFKGFNKLIFYFADDYKRDMEAKKKLNNSAPKKDTTVEKATAGKTTKK